MRIARMAAGISLFGASAWLSPMIAELFGVSHVVGFITVGGLMAFFGGALFFSGVKGR